MASQPDTLSRKKITHRTMLVLRLELSRWKITQTTVLQSDASKYGLGAIHGLISSPGFVFDCMSLGRLLDKWMFKTLLQGLTDYDDSIGFETDMNACQRMECNDHDHETINIQIPKKYSSILFNVDFYDKTSRTTVLTTDLVTDWISFSRYDFSRVDQRDVQFWSFFNNKHPRLFTQPVRLLSYCREFHPMDFGGFQLSFMILTNESTPRIDEFGAFDCSGESFKIFSSILRCNGFVDCLKGEDEENCGEKTKGCQHGYQRVRNK